MKRTVLHFYTRLCHRHVLVGAVSFFAFGTDAARAQTDTSKILKQVIISSTAAPQLQTLTPTQIVTQADFIRTSSLNVADAIRNLAGVNVRDYGGIGGLKTVSVRSLGSNHTAVLYDGLQINDAQTGQIDLSKFNLNNTQQIVLYNAQPDDICMPARSFAAASVLDITTVKPNLTVQKPYKIVAGAKGGSFGLINPYLQWQQRLNNRWSFIMNGYSQHANGRYKFKEERDGSDTLAIRRNSDVKIYQADGGLYWTKSDSSKFNLQVNYYNANRALPGANILYAAYDRQRIYNRDVFIQSGYQHIAKNSLKLLINSKLSRSYLRYFNPNVLNKEGKIDELYVQREAYQSVALSYKPLPKWEVSYSGDVSFSNVKMKGNSFEADPARLSLFNVLASTLVLGKLKLQGNLLHTYITETVNSGTAAASRSIFTPTIIAIVQPFQSANFHVRAFYKNIFRPPTLSEQYYFAIKPRTLKPEYVQQYNLGSAYNKNFDGVLKYISLSADAYYNRVTDKIIFLPGRSTETPTFINLGKVDIRGLDLNVKTNFEPANNWNAQVVGSYTYQHAVNVTSRADSYYGNQIQYTPKHSAALNGCVQYRSFGANYNYTLSSHRYDGFENNNQDVSYMPAYSIHDCSFTYDFAIQGKPVLTAVEVNNIFNKNYSVIQSYPMPGRSLRLTFQITI
ncbi:MAG: TonB-dependent receptor [Sphingobacteriaceae bacterium]|nr:MAG: TonB-dependent receptor [Sphingobacteriaceae bacterium]